MEKDDETITILGKKVPRGKLQKVLDAAAERKAELDPNLEVFSLFGLLDFSSVDPKSLEKTKKFFEILDKSKKVEIQAEGLFSSVFIIGKKSLLKVEFEDKKGKKHELRIPVPVFLRIIDKESFLKKRKFELGTFLHKTLKKYGIVSTQTLLEGAKMVKWGICEL